MRSPKGRRDWPAKYVDKAPMDAPVSSLAVLTDNGDWFIFTGTEWLPWEPLPTVCHGHAFCNEDVDGPFNTANMGSFFMMSPYERDERELCGLPMSFF